MTEQPATSENREKNFAAVDVWIEAISQEGRVGLLDSSVLRSVLSELGADFEQREELEALAGYTNKAKRPGLDAVWGKARVDEYKAFTGTFVEEYEKSTGGTLPALKESGSKTSGMIQFFGELTAFAAGKLNFEDFKRLTEARALNGKLWQEGKKEQRVRVAVPTAKGPILLSSFPPGFPTAAWEKIKGWEQ